MFSYLDFRVSVTVTMPPKRGNDNVDDGDVEGEIKTIQIAKNSKKGEKVMCELCSSFFKSAASLARHKMAKHGSFNEYMCTEICLSSCLNYNWVFKAFLNSTYNLSLIHLCVKNAGSSVFPSILFNLNLTAVYWPTVTIRDMTVT